MSEQDWTPEPWRAGDEGLHMPNTSIMASKDKAVALAISSHPNDRVETDANARRIVACVNACKQLTNQELELMAIFGAIPDAYARLAAAEELLREATNGVFSAFAQGAQVGVGLQDWMNRANAFLEAKP